MVNFTTNTTPHYCTVTIHCVKNNKSSGLVSVIIERLTGFPAHVVLKKQGEQMNKRKNGQNERKWENTAKAHYETSGW